MEKGRNHRGAEGMESQQDNGGLKKRTHGRRETRCEGSVTSQVSSSGIKKTQIKEVRLTRLGH